MKVYTNTTFTGFYPVGTAAVVWASNPISASRRLNKAINDSGLKGDVEPLDMIELKESAGAIGVRILNNGDY